MYLEVAEHRKVEYYLTHSKADMKETMQVESYLLGRIEVKMLFYCEQIKKLNL